MSDDEEEDRFLKAETAQKWAGWSEAFAIFAKYSEPETDFVGTDHHGVYAGPEANKVSVEDRRRLCELGWRPNDQRCCFYAFR